MSLWAKRPPLSCVAAPAAGRGVRRLVDQAPRGDLARSRGRPPPRASSCPASATTAIPPRLRPPQAAPYPVSSLGRSPPDSLDVSPRRSSAVFVDCPPSPSSLCADPRSASFWRQPSLRGRLSVPRRSLPREADGEDDLRGLGPPIALVIVIARWPAGPRMNRPTARPRRLRRGATSTSKGLHRQGVYCADSDPRATASLSRSSSAVGGRREVPLAGRRTRHASGPRSSIVPSEIEGSGRPSELARTSRRRASTPGRGAFIRRCRSR